MSAIPKFSDARMEAASLVSVLMPRLAPDPKNARFIKGAFGKPDPLTTEHRREYARAYQRMLKASGINPKERKR